MQHMKWWKGYYFLAVTPDEYELPLAVAESLGELATMLGKTIGDISFLESRKCDGSRCGYRIVKVWGREEPEPVTYIKSENRFCMNTL